MQRDAFLISVVDDDESVRESLPALLTEFGFVSNSFESAQAFLDSGSAERTDCLILDVAMPKMSGPELWRELVHRGDAIPTIFISAHPEFATRNDVQGGVARLVKPFSDTALLAAVRNALNLRDSD
jgi:FixJ family two-component response regulator